MTERVCVVGAGSFVPARTISNERIAKAIPGWSAARIEEKIGIKERRFLWDFDDETGRAIPPPDDVLGRFYPATNTDMCEVSLRQALSRGGVDPKELDALFVVTCTPDAPHFNHDAMALHERLGLREDAFALVVDDGCGGTPYVLDLVRKMMDGGRFRTVAVVASAFTSPLLNREVYTDELPPTPGRPKALNAYLSMYVFGDGAGAVVLRKQEGDEDGPGILSSFSGNAYAELVTRRGGGMLKLPYQPGRTRPSDMAFVVDGFKVARSYPEYMQKCLDAVLTPTLREQVKRYYFHQPNKRVMDSFVTRAGLPKESVACNVDRIGNTSAAGMLILLADDLEQGRVALGSGDLVVVAAVGANVHYGAQLVRL
ncbi:3-ketoacyl-ACP synthase [Corallococcus exiguus]|uniref:3-ketoacyl-ACP synthase n=1 Tax=Corallococcus exiguus TaxID=83462 RepID=A0A7Y1RZ03_9BACT|nr:MULTISPECIES: 3-oxoacyl-[acyl-carrier-protein] synthase III C-terminal domain-containing protein [Corallococcus]NBC44906.1 3-ketoacyl-ACP synthase [Corallococcus exiguus]NNC15036.1 3-ketoacyl-ACP synthase [Corallococcus exiguus]NRD52404.1 3-ketoacyl-ACP synthase [Corallococcus exiguus]NRD61301.1 3-ketoacyl-ACP synthase [Corallococcus exiguus]RKH29087.1 3-ketoacyl-ACP synthase [Corallococcus sp. CA041A]